MISFSHKIKSTQTVVVAHKYADTSTLGSIDVLRSHRVDMCGPGEPWEPSGEPVSPIVHPGVTGVAKSEFSGVRALLCHRWEP